MKFFRMMNQGHTALHTEKTGQEGLQAWSPYWDEVSTSTIGGFTITRQVGGKLQTPPTPVFLIMSNGKVMKTIYCNAFVYTATTLNPVLFLSNTKPGHADNHSHVRSEESSHLVPKNWQSVYISIAQHVVLFINWESEAILICIDWDQTGLLTNYRVYM